MFRINGTLLLRSLRNKLFKKESKSYTSSSSSEKFPSNILNTEESGFKIPESSSTVKTEAEDTKIDAINRLRIPKPKPRDKKDQQPDLYKQKQYKLPSSEKPKQKVVHAAPASGGQMQAAAGVATATKSEGASGFFDPSCIEQEDDNRSYDIGYPITPISEAKKFIINCLECIGTPLPKAEIVADTLVEADCRGLFCQGMHQLDAYVRSILRGSCKPCENPVILQEAEGTALIDGKDGLGIPIAKFCMDIAIKKAKNVGIGAVSVRSNNQLDKEFEFSEVLDSNHFGMAGMYAMQAMCSKCIGFATSNGTPFVLPHRGTEPAFGCNPLAFTAPGSDRDAFFLDMATSGPSADKIEYLMKQKKEIPNNWALNKSGKPETNAAAALKAGCLLPLGRNENNSSYKGYGISFMVEVLSGVLSGANSGPEIRGYDELDKEPKLGHFFMAIDIVKFTKEFECRVSSLLGDLRKLQPGGKAKVIVPGDRETKSVKDTVEVGGIHYLKHQHEINKRLADELGVEPMRSIC